MKRKIIIAGAILVAIFIAYFKFNFIWTGKEIEIKELGALKLASNRLEHKFFETESWLIIHGEEQRLNWVELGYKLPAVDFKTTFIILSEYKIKSLFRSEGCDVCTGVPDGFAVYDYFGTEKDTYYIYAMPPIMLSQAVG